MDTPQLKWMQAHERHVTRSHKLHHIMRSEYTRYCVSCGEPVNGGPAFKFKGPLMGKFQTYEYLHATWKECKQ